MKKLFVTIVLIAVASQSYAADECERKFNATMDAIKTKHWDAIEEWCLNNQKCEDGAYAAGITGAVMELFTSRWSDLELLSRKFKNPSIKKCVMGHIDVEVSASEPQAARILAQAHKKCAKSQKKLCAELIDVVSAAVLSNE